MSKSISLSPTDSYQKNLLLLIGIATVVRALFAMQVELGNDEVYYWTYVRYPDWSHFDHPPMVGLMGQLFTLNLWLHDDFFLRLGAIVLSAFSTWLIFDIGTRIKNEQAGYYAALLFTGSIYCSLISGFSFSPDAPLVFFWLLALRSWACLLTVPVITPAARRHMIGFGLWAGLAMLSKYQGAFLWVGLLSYVLFYNRQWLKEWTLYLAGLVSLLFLAPIVIWNLQNHFASFTFHGNRVTPALEIRPDYFFTEIFGQVGYNNPINYVLIVVSVLALFRGKSFIDTSYARLLLLAAAPLWLVFTSFSVFRSTLPHWTSPAFLSLMVLAAAYWSERTAQAIRPPFWIRFSPYFLGSLMVIAFYLINYSPFRFGKQSEVTSFGEYDFTQDLYGWQQVGRALDSISAREEKHGRMQAGSDVISYKWFPGAHLDFYAADPLHRHVYLLGTLNDLHKYAWINQAEVGLKKGRDFYHVAVSNVYRDPVEQFGAYFEKIEPLDTVEIKRAGRVMRYAFFYRLKNYNGTFINPLPGP